MRTKQKIAVEAVADPSQPAKVGKLLGRETGIGAFAKFPRARVRLTDIRHGRPPRLQVDQIRPTKQAAAMVVAVDV